MCDNTNNTHTNNTNNNNDDDIEELQEKEESAVQWISQQSMKHFQKRFKLFKHQVNSTWLI